MDKYVDLDANASMPPLSCAKQAMMDLCGDNIANPSSAHFLGRIARTKIDKARDYVAHALGCKVENIIFNSGASEGNRFIVDCARNAGQIRKKPLVVATTTLEHPSLYQPLLAEKNRGSVVVKYFPILKTGEILFDSDIINEADAIFMTAAHNETGIVPNIDNLLTKVKENTIVALDISQSFARLDNLPKRVDIMIASAHKMGAFAGCGALVWRGNASRLPLSWVGGGQEKGFRPGTEALMLIHAFGSAAQNIEKTRKEHQKLISIRDYIESVITSKIDNCFVLGEKVNRLSNTSAICFNGVDGEAMRMAIDLQKICIGFGSACSSLAIAPSQSLISLGLSKEQSRSTIRISLPPQITLEEVKPVIDKLISTINSLK